MKTELRGRISKRAGFALCLTTVVGAALVLGSKAVHAAGPVTWKAAAAPSMVASKTARGLWSNQAPLTA